MRSVEDQQARVQAAAVAPRPVRVAIAEAQGLMCAEEVVTDQLRSYGAALRELGIHGRQFASVHATVFNHFNQERSLSSRTVFKLKRAAALAEWRGLCAE